ncbi:MAG: TlpA family protein disulfide reductase [Chitinophagaceae bacterium]|nr:TlpA family protein disulfide reductase [Chitinophagaceae bacterium]
MKKLLTAIAVIISISTTAFSQKPVAPKAKLTEYSIVKDTTGTEFPYAIWNKLLYTGRYSIKAESPQNENSHFIITRLSDEEFERRMTSLPKPKESKFFTTGSNFSHFKAKDLNGNKISTKDLTGKTIVLNFWFINCPPCQMEMPDLHKLTETFKEDTSIVFLAVALDQKDELKEFLKTHPFGYKIIDDGRYISNQYRLNSYPTNVVITPEGKVYFHSTGLSTNTVYWLKKSIEELKQTTNKSSQEGTK